MTGIKKYKEIETEKTRGKKRYLERVVEEQEAQKEIEEFVREDGPNRIDEVSEYYPKEDR